MSSEYEGFKIDGDGTFSMKVIKPVGKGSIPVALRGSYTSTREAEVAIDRYLANKEKYNRAKTKKPS